MTNHRIVKQACVHLKCHLLRAVRHSWQLLCQEFRSLKVPSLNDPKLYIYTQSHSHLYAHTCNYIYLSIYLSTYPSIHPSIHKFILYHYMIKLTICMWYLYRSHPMNSFFLWITWTMTSGPEKTCLTKEFGIPLADLGEFVRNAQ